MEKKRPNFADLTSLHQSIGAYGETWVTEFLQAMTDLEFTAPSNWNSSYDISSVNGQSVNIEVKTSYYHTADNGNGTKRLRAQFNLTAKDGIDDYLLLLVAIDPNGTHYLYIIPGSEVKTRSIQLTSAPSEYTGKYAQYLFNFDVLFSYLNS